MINKKILYVFAIVMALLVITVWQTGFMMGHLDAYASQCITGITLEDNYKNYDYIFSGRVESIDYVNPIKVQFYTHQSWKGNVTDSMVVNTAFSSDPVLGFQFEEGKHYLVFASNDFWVDHPTVRGCSPTKLLLESKDDVLQLQQLTNFTHPLRACTSDRSACFQNELICDPVGWDCRGGGDSTGVFSEIIELPEPVEPTPTKEETANSQILCIGGYKQSGSECVPDDTLTISYGHQWILKIILIIAILIAIPVGIILGVRVWRKRK